MNKSLRFIHKWVGIVIALVFMISCFTGVMMLIPKVLGLSGPVIKGMKALHCTLFMGETGRLIIGIATLLLVIEIITGYILWGHTAKSIIRKSISNHSGWCNGLRKSLSWRFPNKLWGIHSVTGFWAGIPLLLMAVTGLTWSFSWFGDFVVSIFSSSDPDAIWHTIHGLHVGGIGGIATRWIWIIAAFIGISIPVTGILITIKRLLHKR